jgi:uncharacterized membrane protein YbhN (UPF0104 family)
MSIVSILLVAAGAIALAAFTYVTGAESLLSALTRITWWQFVLVCAVYGAGVIADTLGWRYTLGPDRVPRFLRPAEPSPGSASIVRGTRSG